MPSDTPLPTLDLPQRYQDQGQIGHGGMGQVHRVLDLQLDRTVAMKISHRPLPEEPRLTAKLQHPAIVAIYDAGRLDDGRTWFTMPLVRGRTLAEHGSEHPHPPDPRGAIRALIDVIKTVCQAIAYAHEAQVVHRDLKPDNIMVGAFGEVYVLDWGIAVPVHTPSGMAVGTPVTMAPEQARGERAQTASDVYSLGATLYQVLCGQPPYDVARSATLAVLDGPPVDVSSRATPPPPPPLVDLCNRAMARTAADRPTAAQLADGLSSWLNGTARRARAQAEYERALSLVHQPAALATQAQEAHRCAAEAWVGVAPRDSIAAKRPAWMAEDRARALERQAWEAALSYEGALRSAVGLDPDFAPARQALLSAFRQRLLRAEDTHSTADVARYTHLLSAYDDGSQEDWLAGEGTVCLVTEPPGCQVQAHPVLSVDRRRELGEPLPLGPSPIRAPLPKGSYVLTWSTPVGSVRCPIHLRRGAHWTGVAPGDPAATPIHAVRVHPEHERYIPAGPFLSGGDSDAPDGLPTREIWVDAFVIQTHPVRNGGYLRYLNALLAEGRRAQAHAARPREPAGTTTGSVFRLIDGRYQLGEDSVGTQWQTHWPVVLVDWFMARDYARWFAQESGLPWRLPHDLEWEKAARGVDGRHFPWGSHLDPTWTCMADSHESVFRRTAPEHYPGDVSVYGVHGLGGNVRDWCANAYLRGGLHPDVTRVPTADAPPGSHQMVRGGSYSSVTDFCRSAARFAGPPTQRLSSLGFRLVRSV